MFGVDYGHNFSSLKICGLLILKKEESIWDTYKLKNQIFDIHKFVEKSKYNSKFSQLFYEVTHKASAQSWEQHKNRLRADVGQEIVITVITAILSAIVYSCVLVMVSA